MRLQLLRVAAVAELLQMLRVVAVAVDRRFVGWHHNVRNLTVSSGREKRKGRFGMVYNYIYKKEKKKTPKDLMNLIETCSTRTWLFYRESTVTGRFRYPSSSYARIR